MCESEENVKARLIRLAERMGGVRIMHNLPHGTELHADLRVKLPGRVIEVVFDVGANTGQSALTFATQFPDAKIFSFEPIRSTFDRLAEATRKNARISCFHLALGATTEDRQIAVRELSPNNSLHNLSDGDLSRYPTATRVETVHVQRLDQFVEKHRISHIDLLKIDTEGFDMEVLKGAGELLVQGRVSVLQVEAAMNPQNTKHVPFADFTAMLHPLGFDLFGLYEQTPEWAGEPRLRFCNVVFLHRG